MRNQIIERLKALNTEVPPGVRRFWRIDLHTLPERTQNEPLEMRIKFHAANPNPSATYDTYWRVATGFIPGSSSAGAPT